MPNWSCNTLIIQGKKSDVVAMFAKGTPVFSKNENSDVYTLQSFVPMPTTYKEVDTTNSVEIFISHKKDELIKETFPILKDAKYGEHVFEDTAFKQTLEAKKIEWIAMYNEAKEYQQRTYGVVGWYNWNCQNLGTKWDAIVITKAELDHAIETCIDDDDCVVECVFDTAWTPPIAWLETVVADNPNLYFDMWSDEESGYKWGFEGSEGELSDDLSDGVRDDLIHTISNIDPAEWVKNNEYDPETSKIFIENFEEISENFRDSGFWSRDGEWHEEFDNYFKDIWMSNYEYMNECNED